MDAQSSQTATGQSQPPLGNPIHVRREQVRAHVAAQRERLAQLEKQILGSLERAAEGLAHERELLQTRNGTIVRVAADADARSASLTARAAELERLAEQLDHRSVELATRQEAQAQREAELQDQLAAREAEVAHRTRDTEARLAECERREAELQKRATVTGAAEEDLRRSQAEAGQLQAAREQELALQTRQAAARLAECSQRDADIEQRTAAVSQRETIARQSLDKQQVLDRREQEIVQKVHDIEARLSQCADRETALEARSAAVAAEQEAAARRQAQAERDLAAQQAQLKSQEVELKTAADKVRQDEQQLAADRRAAADELASLKRRADEKLSAVDADHAELTSERDRTRLQRARIVEHLKHQRDAQQQALNERLALIENTASNANATHDVLLADVRRECDRLSEQLQARGDELEAEMAEREQARAEASKLKATVERLSREQTESEQRLHAATSECQTEADKAVALAQQRDQLRTQLTEQQVAAQEPSPTETRARAAAEKLAAERDELSRRLAEAEAALAAAPPATAGEDRAHAARELSELTQRYEMAVRDIRDLKKQNEELTKKASTAPRVAAPGEPLDWEARKRQILQSLEEDAADENEEQRTERLRIEAVVVETQAAMGDKQQEIERLQQLLADRGDGSVESGQYNDPADQDEIVLGQRDRLKKLEAEWEQKLRQAEIDISVERAQLARVRAELEEKQRHIDDQGAERDAQFPNDPGGKSKKAVRGRWLARLGLSDDEK